MRALSVLYQDQLAGILRETDQGYSFQYTESWLETSAKPVSLTLPCRPESYDSLTLFPFFDGLIPEGWLLDIGIKNWKLDPKDRFGLLAQFCRNPIGAVGVEPCE